MTRIAAAMVFLLFGPDAAQADVNLVQVPVACGTIAEVYGLLQTNMPDMANIGSGNDSRGKDVAVLFAGADHWALVATMQADQICVVASGHIWTAPPSAPVAQF